MIFCRPQNNFAIILSVVLILVTFDTLADEHKLPKFELGISLVALNLPDYRGSAGSSSYLLPLPYLRYRGERFKIDSGIEVLLPISEDLVVTISGNGSVPVDNDTPERAGMEELKATLEIGPSLDYRIYRTEVSSLWLELPLRFGFTFESNSQAIGRVFHPRLAWKKPYRQKGDWNLRLALGPMWASRQYHDYYYSIDPVDALPTRPTFQAEAGYSGSRLDFTYSKRFADYWFGGFIRYDNLNGSVFENSSLVSDTSVWSSGMAFSWVFMRR
jgi:outer membrane protein